MPQKLSSYFGVSPSKLRKLGVLDAHIGIDNKLFIDPKLLKRSSIPEFKGARVDLRDYFSQVIRLLKMSKKPGDVAWQTAQQRLTFHEEQGFALGYAGMGAFGRASGPELARSLTQRGKEIVDLGIDDPDVFELIGLFQEGFGADFLSDMAISVLKKRFLQFTDRVAHSLKIKRRRFPVDGKSRLLPPAPDKKRPLVFVPGKFLSKLPIALDRSEIYKVAAFNADVRRAWNAIIGAAAKAKRRVSKPQIRSIFLSNPKNLRDLLKVYKKAASAGYDFKKDPEGILSWEIVGHSVATSYPIDIPLKRPKTIQELQTVLNAIIQQFKKNIEENKLYEVLYSDSGKVRHEVFAQRLFYAVADSYCSSNNIDLNREPNAGNGPVDFKLSSGYRGRVLVEVKKSNNSDLLHGFETQLPSYEKSEATEESVYLILRVNESDRQIQDVLKLREKQAKKGKKTPEVVVVDARKKLSASKRRRGSMRRRR